MSVVTVCDGITQRYLIIIWKKMSRILGVNQIRLDPGRDQKIFVKKVINFELLYCFSWVFYQKRIISFTENFFALK